MRKIESDMLRAVARNESANLGNTRVCVSGPLTEVYLHGNLIARCDSADALRPGWTGTLAGWDTPTTRSRLRALGANLTSKAGRRYINGAEVCESDWFPFEFNS
jgi:hypothetical protein